MDLRRISLIQTQAQLILDHAKTLQNRSYAVHKQFGDVAYLYFLDEIDELIVQYNYIVPRINPILIEEGAEDEFQELKPIGATLTRIRDDNVVFNADRKLVQLLFGSSQMLSFLTKGIVLSESTSDKLDSITKELDSLKNQLNDEYYENLKEAKSEFEGGGFLGASLIAGRVIRVALEALPGDNINEKIEELKKLDLVREKDGRDSIIKASHYGRNLTSHDLSIMPTSSDAISYIAEGIKITKIVSSYLSHVKLPKAEGQK
jgi:hypothetical protein